MSHNRGGNQPGDHHLSSRKLLLTIESKLGKEIRVHQEVTQRDWLLMNAKIHVSE